MKHTFPAKAKITALVCSGRSRPKLNHGPRLNCQKVSCRAMITPTSIPTIPQMTVAVKNIFTIRSS